MIEAAPRPIRGLPSVLSRALGEDNEAILRAALAEGGVVWMLTNWKGRTGIAVTFCTIAPLIAVRGIFRIAVSGKR